jgi:hypothetical protein
MAGALVVIVGVVVTIAFVAWFLIGRTPEQTASHEPADEPRGRVAGRSVAGPADAGAEDQAVPRSGAVGPAATPES